MAPAAVERPGAWHRSQRLRCNGNGTTITISGAQRDGLYELARNHLGSVGDPWDALERDKDFATAARLGLEFGEDFELLEDIGKSLTGADGVASLGSGGGGEPAGLEPARRRESAPASTHRAAGVRPWACGCRQ